MQRIETFQRRRSFYRRARTFTGSFDFKFSLFPTSSSPFIADMHELENMLENHNQLFEEPESEPLSESDEEDDPYATIQTDSHYELALKFQSDLQTKLNTKLNSKLESIDDTEKLYKMLGRVDFTKSKG